MLALSKVTIALLYCFPFSAFAQQAASPAQIAAPEKRPSALAPSDQRRITIDVVVTDRKGDSVPGLQQQDFTILDNKQPQKIVSFRAVDRPNAAVDLKQQAIVLVDAINTSFRNVAFQRVQLESFLRQDGGELPMPMSLFFLSDRFKDQTAVTRDGNVLADALNSIQTSLRITRAQGRRLDLDRADAYFYGDLELCHLSLDALEDLISHESAQQGRKLLIWLGPGWPLLPNSEVRLSPKSRDALFYNLVRVSTALREARVTLYNINPLITEVSPLGWDDGRGQAVVSDDSAIAEHVKPFLPDYYKNFLKGVDSANKVLIGNLALQVLAEQSGGQVINATNDIACSIASCLEDARSFYTLSFDSPVAGHSNEYHSLQVKIGKPGFTGRTRTGYYSQIFNAHGN